MVVFKFAGGRGVGPEKAASVFYLLPSLSVAEFIFPDWVEVNSSGIGLIISPSQGL
jgi:hypothetical protein